MEDILEFDADASTPSLLKGVIEEIDNYRLALYFLADRMRLMAFTLNLIKEAHGILLDGVRGKIKRRGEFRTTQNWIGGIGASLEMAKYVPPSPLILMEQLPLLEKYFHYEDRDALVQLAIIHAQFEILHPFLDGNGRIGRILIPLFLCQKGIISHPCFFIRAYFEKHREEYYLHLEEITKNGKWDDWIAFFLKGIIHEAKVQWLLAKNIVDLHQDIIQQFLPSSSQKFVYPIANFCSLCMKIYICVVKNSLSV
jgi:Fic family protein